VSARSTRIDVEEIEITRTENLPAALNRASLRMALEKPPA
jgi:hypothetical protein